MLEHIILGFLMTKDRSGYDLKWLMENSTSYFINASFGSVYPALKRLAQKNLVTLHAVLPLPRNQSESILVRSEIHTHRLCESHRLIGETSLVGEDRRVENRLDGTGCRGYLDNDLF